MAEELTELLPFLPVGGMLMSPVFLPGERPPDDTPGYVAEMIRAAEEFRAAAEQHTGQEWWRVLPRIPLAKTEVRSSIWKQMEREEITVMYQLRQLGSRAAGVIIQLQLTRGVIREAFSRIQRDRSPR